LGFTLTVVALERNGVGFCWLPRLRIPPQPWSHRSSSALGIDGLLRAVAVGR